MKKIVFFLTFALALTLSACSEMDEPSIENTTARTLKTLATKVSGFNSGRGELVTPIDWKDKIVKPIVPNPPVKIDTVVVERDTTGDGRRQWVSDSIAIFNMLEAVDEACQIMKPEEEFCELFSDVDVSPYLIIDECNPELPHMDTDAFLADFGTDKYHYYYWEINNNQVVDIDSIANDTSLLKYEKIMLAVKLGMKENDLYNDLESLTKVNQYPDADDVQMALCVMKHNWELEGCASDWKRSYINDDLLIFCGGASFGTAFIKNYGGWISGCLTIIGTAGSWWNAHGRNWFKESCENIAYDNFIACVDDL